jgi:hypothetical protein
MVCTQFIITGRGFEASEYSIALQGKVFDSATFVNRAWFDRVVNTATKTPRSSVRKRLKK